MSYYLIMDLIIGTKYYRPLLFRLQNQCVTIVDIGQSHKHIVLLDDTPRFSFYKIVSFTFTVLTHDFKQNQKNKEKTNHHRIFYIYLKIVE